MTHLSEIRWGGCIALVEVCALKCYDLIRIVNYYLHHTCSYSDVAVERDPDINR